MRVRRVLLTLLCLAACGRTELGEAIARENDGGLRLGVDGGAPERDAGQDGGRLTSDAGSLTRDGGVRGRCGANPGPMTSTRCAQRVLLTRLTRTTPTCVVDVRISVGEEGTLTWDCGSPAGGAAEVRFARATFRGRVTAGALEVCTASQFDWTDRCVWISEQFIEGPVQRGPLQLSYAEAPLDGAGCQVPCQATGTFEILQP